MAGSDSEEAIQIPAQASGLLRFARNDDFKALNSENDLKGATKMDIDLPEVVAEVRAAFDRYEKALGDNDVDTLDALFWKNPRTIRYGGAENLYGHDEIAAFRAARSPAGLARTISRAGISPDVRDCAG